MSNGYLVAAEADREAAYALGEGFDLDVIGAASIGDHETTANALVGAANIGLVLSTAAAAQQSFVDLLRALAPRIASAQLIVVETEARAAFAFLPEAWPVMPYDTALERATELVRRRQASVGASEPPHAAPLPPAPPEAEPAPPVQEAQSEPELAREEPPAPPEAPPASEPVSEPQLEPELETRREEEEHIQHAEPLDQGLKRGITLPDEAPAATDEEAPGATDEDSTLLGGVEEEQELESTDSFGAGAPEPDRAAPLEPPAPAREPDGLDIIREIQEEGRRRAEAILEARRRENTVGASREEGTEGPRRVGASEPPPAPAPSRMSGPQPFSAAGPETSAPADATAFAPKKLRRGTPELVRIVIHQPTDLTAVIKAARKIDPRATPAPHSIGIGSVALGARVGVSLEVRGAACDGTPQRRVWLGEPIDFSFSLEADASVKQVVVLARVFVNDAQIGVLAFTRPVIGAEKKPLGFGDKVRLKRHKRVFLSYSSKDRETVAAIATAYSSAGVEHFWDRTSLKSGEEWSPRLRREIERADLFHLCWSKSAANSEWVEKEAQYALTRRRRAKKPEITVQMLDGPPWAKHPDSLDSINFDDFVRAAIVGYARGDGSES